MWHSIDGMGWGMLWGGLMMILFWGFVVALATWGVQAITRRASAHAQAPESVAPSPPSLDIVRERYACGDIDSEEFDEIRSRLEYHRG